MGNPWDSVECHYCNGKGCLCPSPKLDHHDAVCVPCDTCGGSGQLSVEQLNRMARDYKADEQFKRAWKSAMLILICSSAILGFCFPLFRGAL